MLGESENKPAKMGKSREAFLEGFDLKTTNLLVEYIILRPTVEIKSFPILFLA